MRSGARGPARATATTAHAARVTHVAFRAVRHGRYVDPDGNTVELVG